MFKNLLNFFHKTSSPQQQRLAEIARTEKMRQQAIEQLRQYLPDTIKVEPLSTKMIVARMVDRYSVKYSLPLTFCWNMLYTEFNSRFGVNLPFRGDRHSPRLSGIEYAEQYGLLEHLYSVSLEIFN